MDSRIEKLDDISTPKEANTTDEKVDVIEDYEYKE